MTTELTTADATAQPLSGPAAAAARIPGFDRIRGMRYSRAVGVFLAVHVPMMILLVLFLRLHHTGLEKGLTAWDGRWYKLIAANGYQYHFAYKHHVLQYSSIAFFPGYPMLMAAVHAVTGLSVGSAGILISWVAAPVAAAGIYAALRQFVAENVALCAVALWGVLPIAYIEVLAYTESTYTAFAAWGIYALVRKRWLTAGLLAGLAGLTHSTAVVLIGVVGLAALVELWQRRGDGFAALWRPAAACLLAPAGILGFFLFLWEHTGIADAWFKSEKAGTWDASFDFGHQTFSVLWHQVSEQQNYGKSTPAYLVATAVIVPLAVSVVALWRRRVLSWQVLVWVTLSLASTVLTSGIYSSKARFLLPLFPLLLPAAGVLSRAPRSTRYATFGVLAVVAASVGVYFLRLSGAAP
jgi:Gpi18-like mannosyltransferase